MTTRGFQPSTGADPNADPAEAPPPIRTVAIVGTGVIGAGWVARCLHRGLDVRVATLNRPTAEPNIREVVANSRAALDRVVAVPDDRRGALTFVDTIAEAVAGADYIQESVLEDEDIKIPLLAEIDAHTRPDALVGSSTSGLLPTRLQSGMTHPERFFVAHPFNPVYLLPLVEICGGERTTTATTDRAAAFLTSIGMKPLLVRKEIDGFLADRLLESLWREILWLVHDDVATTGELDDAITYGAGLRWAFMGTNLTYLLAGGKAGMRHFLSQFGPALKLPWTHLEAPELTDELIDKMVAGTDAQGAGRDLRDLEQLRDNCLVSIMEALETYQVGAGAVLAADRETQRLRLG